MRSSGVAAAAVAGIFAVYSVPAMSQDGGQAAQPAPSSDELPAVEVIQKEDAPAPAAQDTPPPQSAVVAPAPQPPPPAAAEALPPNPNPIYGSPAAAGAEQRATVNATTPVNPTALVPSNLRDFSSAATIVTQQQIEEQDPDNINNLLKRVPGVVVINDDSAAHHGGIGIRGAPPRRSRKMLVMEDGHTVNLALWLDPSVHYWAPMDRIESVEVLRGTIITHGPNNNFGVINSRNLSPFGPSETVISSAIGFTKTRSGTFRPVDEIEVEDGDVEIEFDDPVSGKSETDISARWHVHTRQSAGNVGLVASYTGEDIQGAWDTERLRVHDFYGALGWSGPDSDLTVSAIHARQRDNYDEQNFLGFYEVEFDPAASGSEDAAANAAAGIAEGQFGQLRHCKTCFAPAAGLNTYTGEIWRGQAVYNAYLDDDTTITSRIYAGYHRRDRYQLLSFGSNPDGSPGLPADIEEADGEVLFGEDSMFGRLRTFRHLGGELRGEWANRQLFGFTQDFQAGIRYEYQDMTNRNFLGANNQILTNGDDVGATIFERNLSANTVSAYLQTNVHVASDFNVLPGIRFEWYDVNRRSYVVAEEEGEAEEADSADCIAAGFGPDCLAIEGINFNPNPRDGTSSFNALPGVAFAYTGFYRSTLFGGYHRGLTTNVLRNETFPSPDEIGDNFSVGLRSSAIKGFDFEVVGFYNLLKNFQYGESFASVTGDREFGRADEASIKGVELNGRLNSQPFTGGPFNFFAEGNYSYSRSTLDKAFTYEDDGSIADDYSGNRIPETPWHVAAITLGVEQHTGWRWNASVTWTYRGSFYTDAANTPYGYGFEAEEEAVGEYEIEEAGEGGGVPSVWLLSARFNLDIGDTGASVFVSGTNLLDEFYITDREDGMKPGLGRTVWTGFKYKF